MTTTGVDEGRPARPASRDARRQRIVDHVLAAGSASAAGLAELTGVSLMTVHRDVDELVRRGLVRKYRGGVSAQPSSVFEAHSEYRLAVRTEQKAAIAEVALTMVEPGSSIMIDDSTTALALARRLGGLGPLTVVTNYVPVIEELRPCEEVRLIALGGDYLRSHDSFVGIGCLESVAAMSVDTVFVSTSSMTGSMTFHQEPDVVMVKRAMIDAAARSVLLMDSSKVSRRALHRLRPLDAFDHLIMDDGVPDDVAAELREHVDLTLAPRRHL